VTSRSVNRLLAWCVWLGFWAFVIVAQGQSVGGTINGRVSDQRGTSIPNVLIEVIETATGFVRSTRASTEGYYQSPYLPLGWYRVKASASGFVADEAAVRIDIAGAKNVNFALHVAGGKFDVTVVATVDSVQTDTASHRFAVDENVIDERPNPGRHILSLLDQIPGFQSGSYAGVENPVLSSGTVAVYNGSGSRATVFQTDGVSNDDSSESIMRQPMNISSIRQVVVLTSLYPAEFGRSGGAVVLVQTKSGTNSWHGDAYEFLQNDQLNSNSFFNNALGRSDASTLIAPRTIYRRNQYGYTIGGPLIKDRLFIFHSFEQSRMVQHGTIRRFIFLPSDRIQIGSCRLCVNPAEHPNVDQDVRFLQSILDRFPKQIPNATSVCDRCYVETKRSRSSNQDYSGKIDWLPHSRDTAAIRYQYSRQRAFPGELIPGEAETQNHRQASLGVTDTHVFAPWLLGEFRFGLGLRTTLVDVSGGNTTPIIRISNPSAYTTTLLGSAGAYPIHRRQTAYQYVFNLSAVRGRHMLKTGTDVRRQHLDDFADNFSRGRWTFGPTGVLGAPNRFEGYENFLRGYATGFAKGFGNFYTANRMFEINSYVLDDWRVTPALTVNLGFRHEWVTAPREVRERIVYGYGGFAGYEPRIGFAWAPRRVSRFWSRVAGEPGSFSLRGGFGLFHNRIFQSIFSQGGASLRSAPPYGVYRSFDPTFHVADPSQGFAYSPAVDPGQIDITTIAPDLRMPTVQQYNLTYDRQWGKTTTISIAFVRTRGIGLLQHSLLNRARFPQVNPRTGILYDKIDPDLGNINPPAGFISLANTRSLQRRPDPHYGHVFRVHNGAWSYYNGLQVSARKQYSRGLQYQLTYAFSKTMDTGSDYTAGYAVTEFASAASLRGLSDFHQQHRLTVNYSYDFPSPSRAHRWRRALFRTWTIAGTNTFASGNPFTVVAGYDVNADGWNNDRPLLVDNSVFGRSVDDARQDPQTGLQRSTLQLPASAFYPNADTPYNTRSFDPGGSGAGSIGRNTFFGAGMRTWDLALMRTVWIREALKLRIRVEAYNVTNTPRFAFPVRDLQNPSFGRILTAYNPQNFVGSSRSDDATRMIQFSARLVF
jgi:hypothetical protein